MYFLSIRCLPQQFSKQAATCAINLVSEHNLVL